MPYIEYKLINKAITVGELLLACEDAVNKGMAKKRLYICIDEEGNDYHPCYFNLSTDPDKVRELLFNTCSGLNRDDDINDIALLG